MLALMRRVQTVQTSFQKLEIWKSDAATEFRVEGAIHAWHHKKRFLTGLAWDLIAASTLLRSDGSPRSILMLGLAGGTAFRTIRHLLPDCRLVAVDIDRELIDHARVHMDLDALGIEIHIGDAYQWLAENRNQFDVVFDDIYLAGKSDVFRPKAWDGEIMRHLKRAMAPGGLLAVNLVTGLGHRKMQSLTRKILKDEFEIVRSLTTLEGMNEVLVAGVSVGTRAQLDAREEDFTEWRDRVYWERVKVKRI